MTFRSADLWKTTRRDQRGGPARLFPRLLGDDRFSPRLGLAIRFFETHCGRPRGTIDGPALVSLIGDAKLARCLVSCLAQTYHYRTQHPAEVLGAERAAALAARGLGAPHHLRALVYAQANQDGGFVPPLQRAAWLADLVDDLSAAELETLLWLDAPDQAILTRVGPVPTVAELRARYNAQLLETLLSLTTTADLTLRGTRAAVTAVATRHGVPVTFSDGRVHLSGQTDAAGSWLRYGGRLARTALTLLAGAVLGPGQAMVALGDQSYHLAIDAALLRRTLPPQRWLASRAAWTATDRLVAALPAARRDGLLAGWRLRRWPAPLVTEQGIAWPELSLSHGTASLSLLALTTDQVAADATALHALAARWPLVVLQHGRRPVTIDGLPLVHLGQRGTLAALATVMAELVPAAQPTPAWVTAVVDAARQSGWVTEAELAQRLDCDDEAVADHLTAATAQCADLVYVDGFGLCSVALVDRARELVTAEVDANQGRLELARLGRRLRLLVGRNEGLHALIAHLSGELRPVA